MLLLAAANPLRTHANPHAALLDVLWQLLAARDERHAHENKYQHEATCSNHELQQYPGVHAGAHFRALDASDEPSWEPSAVGAPASTRPAVVGARGAV